MVGPIWGNKINTKMGKPQSKVEIQENIVNNGNSENNKLVTQECIITLGIVALVLYIAYKINNYFKNYVHKHNSKTITDV